MAEGRIPKLLHVIWVGDEEKRPDHWIKSWYEHHPTWEIILWGNDELDTSVWRCQRQLELFARAGVWEGVADIMRYEILYGHGGVYVDADSICVKPMDDLLDNRLFAVWASEKHLPGRIANGFIGCEPEHLAMQVLLERISRMKNPLRKWSWRKMKLRKVRAWESVGPKLFTDVLSLFPPDYVKILPSITFIPQHYFDADERTGDLVYARHMWGTTKNLY